MANQKSGSEQFHLEQPGEFSITLSKSKTNENQRADQVRSVVDSVRATGYVLDLFEQVVSLFIPFASLALLGFVPASLLVSFWSVEAVALTIAFYAFLLAFGVGRLLAAPLTWRRRLVAFGVFSLVWVCFCGGLNYG
jgi:hypothetical protein